jgi:hypothetical protein
MTLYYIQTSDMIQWGTVQSGSSSIDYNLLTDDCGWAEQMFHELNGHTDFYSGSPANEEPRNSWVDRYGWIDLHSGSLAPVTSVQSVQYMIPGVNNTWQNLSWDPLNGIFLPPQGAPPNPRAWVVQIIPSNVNLGQAATGDIRFRWSYTGGYQTTPASLKITLLRLGWWKYKLREAPLGKIASPPFGITEVIPGLPKDVVVDLGVWTYRLA